MIEFTLSVKAIALFCARLIALMGIGALLGFFMYYTDDPRVKPSKVKNTVYTVFLLIAFVFIFGIVQINWVQ